MVRDRAIGAVQPAEAHSEPPSHCRACSSAWSWFSSNDFCPIWLIAPW